jgi:hypothetical protein
MRAHAAVAQLVEQRIRNAKVTSSTPVSGTIQEHLPVGFDPGTRKCSLALLPGTRSDVKTSILLLLLALPALAMAEDDGEEFLELMEKPAARQAALAFIDSVRNKWDGSVFCVVKGNPQAADDPHAAAFAAVKTYLESHPEERYRPRRYLITQALLAAYPCAPR